MLSRNQDYRPKDCTVYHSKDELVKALEGEEVFISGGEQIYRQFMEDCQRFYVTKIYDSFPADRSFPNLDEMGELAITWKSDIQEEKGIRYQFFEYTRE